MQIRPIRPEEHVLAGDLILDAYRQVHDDLGDYADALASVGQRVDAGATVLVAVEDGVIAGCVTYVPPGLDSDLVESNDPRAAGIRMLAVDPSRQGRGIGRALTIACMRAAEADGADRVVLNTTDRVPAAHRLYLGLGFRRTPDLDVLVDDDLWLRAYELPLPPRQAGGGALLSGA